jgi:hypothetical protein
MYFQGALYALSIVGVDAQGCDRIHLSQSCVQRRPAQGGALCIKVGTDRD